MKRISLFLPVCCALFIVAGCDFPADPPVKPAVNPPPLQPLENIDSAASLLPLHKGISWVYIAQPMTGGAQGGSASVT